MAEKRLIIISDGIGDTAREIVDCTMAQFPNADIKITKHTKISTTDQLATILKFAKDQNGLLIFTITQKELRTYLLNELEISDVEYIDILGPMLQKVERLTGEQAQLKSGLYRTLDDQYFKRVGAMEFTLNNDDGKQLKNIAEADIILVGVSRTSKTPLSMYLSMQGYKTINVPLIRGVPLPDELLKADQKKIFALTISPEHLTKIRSERLNQLNADLYHGGYANYDEVTKELEWANEVFKNHSKWPLFDVSNKAIEETAAEILKILKISTLDIF